MKQLYLLLLIALSFSLSASAQEYVIDPQYLLSVESNQAVRMSAEQTHNQYLDKINNKGWPGSQIYGDHRERYDQLP